ncbi:MAG: peroxiredoxin [Candidatus Thermoplasmatota archaeon]|nr:peroxiredoxin [Candidatus Thermoplasmatota archaeon]
MTVNVGEKAPDFKALDSSLKEKKLEDYKGHNTVLAFFPGAFTSVCTKEMCTFRDSLSAFNNLNAKVVGISVDSPFSLAEFGKVNRLNFDLLSDSEKQISKSYGSLYESFLDIPGLKAAKRSVFVLDKNGVVKFKWVSEDARVEPDYEAVKKEIQKLK